MKTRASVLLMVTLIGFGCSEAPGDDTAAAIDGQEDTLRSLRTGCAQAGGEIRKDEIDVLRCMCSDGGTYLPTARSCISQDEVVARCEGSGGTFRTDFHSCDCGH